MLYGKQTPKYCLRICRDELFYVCAWSEGDDAPSTEELVTIDIKNLRMEINGSARSDFNAALEKAGYDYKNGSGSWSWKNNIDFGKDENGNTDYFSEIIKYNSLAVNRTVYKINRINNNPLHGLVCSDVKYAKAGNTVTANAAFYMMTESNDYLINPLERYNSWGKIDIVEYFSTGMKAMRVRFTGIYGKRDSTGPAVLKTLKRRILRTAGTIIPLSGQKTPCIFTTINSLRAFIQVRE